MFAGNATIEQLQREILPNTKRHYMKGSNTLAGNATIKQLQRQVLLDTKEQYMKESNTLAGNASIKQAQYNLDDLFWRILINLEKKLEI